VDRVGLVGLPNSGKSALFNALTGGNAVVAPHPFSTIETEVGVAHVPDPRVDALAQMSRSRKIVYTGYEVVDIAAVGKGGERGDALGGRFLAIGPCSHSAGCVRIVPWKGLYGPSPFTGY